MNSRNKGKRGELALCRELRKLGFIANRTVQHQGLGSAGDVSVAGTTLHTEGKLRAKITAVRWLEQAIRDCRRGWTPWVVMKEDRGPFVVMCRLDDMPALIDQWLAGRAHGESNEADRNQADAASAHGCVAGHAAAALELR